MKTNVRKPIGIDLFAGAGGMSLGFEQAGFHIAVAVEIDPIHCCVHEFNFPETKTICASVVELDGKTIREKACIENEDIDVVFGGPPCQGFSMIGKRSFDDPRNSLVLHFVRLVGELKPKFCVMENVKGLTIGKQKGFLTEVMNELDKVGYDAVLPYKVLNASDYGVPQDRHRLFLVARRKDITGEFSYPVPNPRKTTVRDAIRDIPDAEIFSELSHCEHTVLSDRLRPVSEYASILSGLSDDPEDYSTKRQFDPLLLTGSIRTEHGEISRRRFEATAPGTTEPVSRFYKLSYEGRCNTLRAGTDSAHGAFTSPRPIHPEYSRCITIREAARLHSYPDWFRFHSTKWHGMREIGNSVPPLLARSVARSIIEALNVKPSRNTSVYPASDEALLLVDMTEAAFRFSVSRNTISGRTRKTTGSTHDGDCES